jgi:MFS family permease
MSWRRPPRSWSDWRGQYESAPAGRPVVGDQALTGTFSSLANRNFRLFVSGSLVSNTGTWMQRVAQDWLVLTLTGGSGTALGITTALQFLPLLLFSLWGGVLADRLPKRRLLLMTQTLMGLQALVLGVLVLTGHERIWQVYLLAFVLGVAAAADTPARQAFVPEMVGGRALPNAVALGSATFNLGRVLGPAAAGVLITAVGTGAVFLVNAASYVAVIASLLAMRVSELRPTQPVQRAPGQLREGLRYVRGRHDLLLVMVVVAAVGTFGLNFQITTALMATGVYHVGAREFGLLTTAFAVGSLAGALASAHRAGRAGGRPGLRFLIVLASSFGVIEAVSGLAPTYTTFLVLLVPTGLLAISFATSANPFLQLGSAPTVRGRVMSLYVLVFFGGTPIGAPLIGWLAQVAGARWALIGGGLLTVCCTLVAAALLRPRPQDTAAAAAASGPVPTDLPTVPVDAAASA